MRNRGSSRLLCVFTSDGLTVNDRCVPHTGGADSQHGTHPCCMFAGIRQCRALLALLLCCTYSSTLRFALKAQH
jgi:hypothetical protein